MPLLFRYIARLHSRRWQLCNLTGKKKVFADEKGSSPKIHQPSSAGKKRSPGAHNQERATP